MLAREIKANLILLLVSIGLVLIEVTADFKDSTCSEVVETVCLLPVVYLLLVLAPLRYLLLGVLWGLRQLLHRRVK